MASIFDQTFNDTAPETLINIKTLLVVGYKLTIRYEDITQLYHVLITLSSRGSQKRFSSSLLENAIDSALRFAKEYDEKARNEDGQGA